VCGNGLRGAGLSGKTPCHIVQSVKATFPTDTKDVYRLVRLWSFHQMCSYHQIWKPLVFQPRAPVPLPHPLSSLLSLWAANLAQMMAMLWSAGDMEMEDKSLVLSRLKSDYER
jgi:hypothetical protein